MLFRSALPSGVAANTVYEGYSPAGSVTLAPAVTGGSPAYSYNWSNGTTGASATVSPSVNSTYTLIVTDANGCADTAIKAIAVVDVRAGKKLDKVAVCHKGGTNEISSGTVADHLAHGDMLGSCNTPNYASSARSMEKDAIAELTVAASPNPTTDYFILSIKGNGSNKKIKLRVIDLLGRSVERMDNVSANQSIRIGSNYLSGTYFAEVIQGDKKVVIQLSKQ